MYTSSNGNILFLILIAVGLFAALSFAVSQTSRSAPASVAKDKGDLTAGRILNFASSVQAAALRITTSTGSKISDIKFNNDVSLHMNGTPMIGAMGSPSSPDLYVFHPKGGGAVPQVFEDSITPCTSCNNQVKAGHFNVIWLNVPNAGTDQSDFALHIADIDNEACLAINRRQGVAFIPNTVFNGATTIGQPDPATLAAISGIETEDQDAILGKSMLCVKKTNNAIRNNFYAVLKAF